MNRFIAFILILGISVQLQATSAAPVQRTNRGISFAEYYQAHQDEVDQQIKDGVLDLSNKSLKDLDGFDIEHMPRLAALRELGLGSNHLEKIAASTFNGMSALESLVLNNNKFTDLPNDVFDGLNALTTLVLNNNQFVTLPDALFSGLTALEMLYLYNNQLSILPHGIFRGLTALKQIYLENNQFIDLPNDIFLGLSALRKVCLYNNPIAEIGVWKMRQNYQLSEGAFIDFKRMEQEKAEENLIHAITRADIDKTRVAFKQIMTGEVKTGLDVYRQEKIDISKIRDTDGNNLLHIIINGYSMIKSRLQKENEEIREYADIAYGKVFMILVQFGGPKVQDMLLTRNKSGDDVLTRALALLGENSLIVSGIWHVLAQLPEKAVGTPMPRFIIKHRLKSSEENPEAVETMQQQAMQRTKLLKTALQ